MNLEAFREALLQKKQELTEAAAVRPLQATMENNSRQGDMADQASGNNEVHIALKLRQTDAKILQAIEEALQRIEKGTYGVCRDCGEPIAEARLRAIPWTRVCISLQGKAKGVKPTDLVALLQECYRDRLALVERHKAVAVHVPTTTSTTPTSTSSTAKRRTSSGWRDALVELGAPLPDAAGTGRRSRIERSKDAWRPLAAEDARAGQAFLAKWRPRVESLSATRATRRCSG